MTTQVPFQDDNRKQLDTLARSLSDSRHRG